MADIYVVDAHALIELQQMGMPRPVLHEVLDQMTQLIKTERLCFPNPVVKFCKTYARNESVAIWVDAVSGHRYCKSVDVDYQTEVMDRCDEIADPDDPEESVPLFVAAMCLEIRALHMEAVVVTEDCRPQPTRMCLAEACGPIGIPSMRLSQFLANEIVMP